jgi:coenzyme F420-reducing hydrogenase gamma subunit
MAEKAKIATMWLAGCSGCHLSIADIHEAIIDVMGLADFEFSPVLMEFVTMKTVNLQKCSEKKQKLS